MSKDDWSFAAIFALIFCALLTAMTWCAPVPHESPAQHLGWVGAYGRVTSAGQRMCREHGQADCTAAWLEGHAAAHAETHR